MQKNNIRNFVCSFLFSILAVFCIQKVFFRTPNTKNQPQTQTLKLERIQLFSKNQSKTADNIASNKTARVDISDINALTVPQELKQKEPLTEQPEPVQIAVAEDHEPQISVDIRSSSEITLTEEELSEINDTKQHVQSGIVYAQDDSSSKTNPEDEEIPLSENGEVLHAQINLAEPSAQSQIAMIEPEVLINTIDKDEILDEQKDLAEANIKNNELSDTIALSENTDDENIDPTAWQTASVGANEQTSQNTEQDSPWVVAKGNKFAKNQAVVEKFENAELEQDTRQEPLNQDDRQIVNQTFVEPLLKQKNEEENQKLAYQMIQNILIPIPEDISSDTDLVPNLTASPKGKTPEKKIVSVPEKTPPQLDEEQKDSTLFKSISSWFSKNKEDLKQTKTENTSQKNTKSSPKRKFFSISSNREADDSSDRETTNIVPAELRLSFQPNRAEISGQTLKWIYAFADNARDNDDVYVEVRIDGTSSYALQQKRLNLLSSIFSSRGVDYRKVRTIFTSREPNSFIIRNIRFNNTKGEQTINTSD